jgi:hypothetical protein
LVDLIWWEAVDVFGFNALHHEEDVVKMRKYLDEGNFVILNVRNGHHWVLTYGYEGDTWYVNDSGFDKQTYNTSDIVSSVPIIVPAKLRETKVVELG